jgi:superfamily II DNA/RNA helicase
MSKDVEESIRKTFNMQDIKKIAKAYPRPNLHYSSFTPTRSFNEDLLQLINQDPLVPTVVYFSTVKLVEETYKLLARAIKGGCMAYTGKMANAARAANQDNFISGKVRVAFATNSFGMGVDKPDIGRVIFRTIPGSIEELVQGFGRGGRNGCDCDCILMGDLNSLNTQYWFKDMQYPEKYTIERFYKALLSLREDGDIVNQTLSTICSHAGIDPMFCTALVNILKGYNVIDREDRNSIAKIKFLNIPEDEEKNKKFKQYYDNILLYGLDCDNYLSIDLELLAEEIGVGVATIKSNLKSFAEMDLIDYKAPGNQPLKIIGDIKQVDFNYIDFLRDQKEDKINEMLKYFNLDDDKKDKFLTDYFNALNE